MKLYIASNSSIKLYVYFVIGKQIMWVPISISEIEKARKSMFSTIEEFLELNKPYFNIQIKEIPEEDLNLELKKLQLKLAL